MTPPINIRRTLILVNMVAFICLSWLTFSPVRLPKPDTPFIDTTIQPPILKLADLPSVSLDQISARPLFMQNRTPSVDPFKEPPPTIVPASINLSLEGVIYSGQTKLALMRAPRDTTAKRLQVGDQINGWRIETIQETSVVLMNNGQRHTLSLRSGVSDTTLKDAHNVSVRSPVAKRPAIRK